MGWWWLAIAAGVYLSIGVAFMFMLFQTPYAENPLWAMVLLWPLYLFAMFQ